MITVLSMIDIHGLMVVKNEKDRYLEDCIKWNKQFLDNIFVYDDRSTDGSAELALDLGCVAVKRPENKSSFIEHEGNFRMSSWKAFEQKIKPKEGDWILSFDADEFLVSDQDIFKSLSNSIKKANYINKKGVVIPFKEIFKIDNGEFFYRTDGYWNTVRGSRLFKWFPAGAWSDKSMGCGSEPTYVNYQTISNFSYGLHFLHLGYAKDEDKRSKYERYSSLADHGHQNDHIQSILKTPKLEKWEGMIPDVQI